MKKLIAGLLILVGCTSMENRLVDVSDKAVRTTTSIEVTLSEFRLVFTETENGLEISAVPVQYRGAGVFITPTGHVLTCAHLFWSDKVIYTEVTDYYGNVYVAELLSRDDKKDLALLKVTPKKAVEFARLGDPRKLRVGQEVIAIGNPHGLAFTVTSGIISALNRDLREAYNMTQSDAAINPGNSGGPLFNLKGEIIGINVLGIVNSVGLGFSVQSGQIVEFLTKYRGIDKAIPKFGLSYWQRFIKALV
jgi:S1-C subfamily serine protease